MILTIINYIGRKFETAGIRLGNLYVNYINLNCSSLETVS